MIDLSREMEALAVRLGPPRGAVAKIVMFAAATSGEGTSTVAREFASRAARSARRGVWLVELDLMAGEQHAAIAAEPRRYGGLGSAVRASPDGAVFFAVDPKTVDPQGRPWPDDRYLAAHGVGDARFWVTRFRREALAPGQGVRLLAEGDYWRALRAHADWVVIDAPSADRSDAALAVAPHADDTVLVVSGDARDGGAASALREAVAQAGGRCPGFVFNRARREPPAFLRRLLP